MTIHVCQLCGYEYDPRMGDVDGGVDENTDFEDLPANWVCPLCGATREDFEAEEREEEEEF